MKDSQPPYAGTVEELKYIKADNERFSTYCYGFTPTVISISRLIMKDSQPKENILVCGDKYIKADNERFSTQGEQVLIPG